jgi:DNA-binding transcriptional MocR family regulator
VERLVAYVPGTAFYPDGRGRNQMRLAFCYPTDDRIRDGIARLGSLLSDEEQLYRSLHP